MEDSDWEDRDIDPTENRSTGMPRTVIAFLDKEEHDLPALVLYHRKYGPAYTICECGYVQWDISTFADDAHDEMCDKERKPAECEHGIAYMGCDKTDGHWQTIDEHYGRNKWAYKETE